MKTILGEYNDEMYIIYEDGEEIYRAGNSSFESQTYVPAGEGVGLSQMGKWCRQTGREMAKERRARYLRSIYLKKSDAR